MPVHNGAPFVTASIGSILAQTLRDFELVIVNDGSSDGTGTLLDSLAEKDSRLRIIHLPQNLGIVGALNRGLESCSGQYIARMDGDDIARRDRLTLQVAFLDENPDFVACGSDLIFFGARYWYARYPRTDVECKSLLALYPCLSHPATTIRRNAMECIDYKSDYSLAEDYRLWLDLAPLGKFANLPRPLTFYRIHPSQISTASNNNQRKVHVRIAAESLASFGLSHFSAEDVTRFVWPAMANEPMTRREYLEHAIGFSGALWNINQGRCRWLRARLLRVTMRNLLFLQ